jgi:RNA polymerase sigma-70 factor (ECF subfamily)
MMSSADEEVLKTARNGDEAAFSALYDKYARRLYAYCYRLTANRDSAEDIVQTTFLKAYESLSTLDKPDSFHHWLFSIARNEAYSFLRQRRTNAVVKPFEQEDVWDLESPLEKLVHEETTEMVQRFLGELKVEYREVLVLRQYEQLSYIEIAAITGDTVSSVESRLFKARKALAKKLAPYVK